MWQEGSYVLFECSVEETGKACLTGGWVKLENAANGAASTNETSSQSDAVFDQMSRKLTPEMVTKVGATFRWIITDANKNPTAQWGKKQYLKKFESFVQCFLIFLKIAMDLKMPPGKIFKEKLGSDQLKADCTLTLSEKDLLSMVCFLVTKKMVFLDV